MTRDAAAARDVLIRDIKIKVSYLDKAKESNPCTHCGMRELLLVQLWNLEHPDSVSVRKVALITGAVAAGVAAAVRAF